MEDCGLNTEACFLKIAVTNCLEYKNKIKNGKHCDWFKSFLEIKDSSKYDLILDMSESNQMKISGDMIATISYKEGDGKCYRRLAE